MLKRGVELCRRVSEILQWRASNNAVVRVTGTRFLGRIGPSSIGNILYWGSLVVVGCATQDGDHRWPGIMLHVPSPSMLGLDRPPTTIYASIRCVRAAGVAWRELLGIWSTTFSIRAHDASLGREDCACTAIVPDVYPVSHLPMRLNTCTWIVHWWLLTQYLISIPVWNVWPSS